MTDPAASTNSSSYRRRFRLVPVIEVHQCWAPALAVSVDSRPDQACDELWNRYPTLVNKEVKFAPSNAR